MILLLLLSSSLKVLSYLVTFRLLTPQKDATRALWAELTELLSASKARNLDGHASMLRVLLSMLIFSIGPKFRRALVLKYRSLFKVLNQIP